MFRTITLTLSVLFLSGCKLAVLLVEGGEVQSIGSGTCMTSPTVPQTGAVCIHDVPDSTYAETFTAAPDTGWEFVKWNSGGGFLCANSTTPSCTLTMVPFAGVEDIDAAIAADNTTLYLMPIFERAVPEYSPEAASLFFVDGIISEVYIYVAPEWLESNIVSYSIEASGINGGFHEHGAQEGLVSSATVIIIDVEDAIISVEWNTDEIITASPETYTICVRALINGQPFGLENCAAFGPY